MSKIQSIQPNYQQKTADFNKNRTNFAKKQKFTGGGFDDLAKGAQDIFKQGCEPVSGKMRSKFNKACTFLSDHDSEIQTQLINAVFTSTLAPLMIGWNPFTKQDEKTKKYTALRQPISATIAISGGYMMTKSLDDYMNFLHSEGHSPYLDLRMNPDKHYLEGKFKKVFADATDKDKFLSGLNPDKEKFKDIKDASGNYTKQYLKACKKAYPQSVQDARQKLFTSLISEKPENIVVEDGVIFVKDANSKKEIGRNIPNLGTKAELDKYLEHNNLNKMKLNQFMTNQFKFDFYDGGEIQPQSIGKKLSEVKAMDFLKSMGLVDPSKISEDELRSFAQEYRQSKPNNLAEVEGAFRGGTLIPDGAKKLFGAFGKDASRGTQMTIGEEIGKSSTLTLGQFFHQMGYKLDDGSLQKLVKMDVVSVLNEFADNKLKNLSVKTEETVGGKTVEKLTKVLDGKKIKDFAGTIIKNKAAKIGKNFGNYKKYVGIGFNLPMTAVTCTILNWVYPRVVERLFPSLVKDDSKKGGNK